MIKIFEEFFGRVKRWKNVYDTWKTKQKLVFLVLEYKDLFLLVPYEEIKFIIIGTLIGNGEFFSVEI